MAVNGSWLLKRVPFQEELHCIFNRKQTIQMSTLILCALLRKVKTDSYLHIFSITLVMSFVISSYVMKRNLEPDSFLHQSKLKSNQSPWDNILSSEQFYKLVTFH